MTEVIAILVFTLAILLAIRERNKVKRLGTKEYYKEAIFGRKDALPTWYKILILWSTVFIIILVVTGFFGG